MDAQAVRGCHGESGPRLLLADDDAALRETLGRALAQRGFVVDTASTEEEATRSATDNPPEYALTDLRLGERSGLKLIAKLLHLDCRMRIVVLTGYGSIATAIEAIKLGAKYYLCKPADPDQIVAAFHRDTGDDSITSSEKPMSIGRLEWEHICRVLREHKGNISQAARALSMHRRTLQRKLSKRPVRI